LEEIILLNSIIRISKDRFYKCSQLTQINISGSIKELREDFLKYKSLKEISLPHSITTIGRCCFDKCSQLTQINVSSLIKELAEEFLKYKSLKEFFCHNQSQQYVAVTFIKLSISSY
jgi:hypothetical protein